MSASPPCALVPLRKARLAGNVSACFCLVATLLMLDGLQALMRNDFNRINLSLGGQAHVSGAMPQEAKDHSELVASIEGNDGISFTPLTSFKGFWMGAAMWRGVLAADAAAAPGEAILTILDLVPAKSTTSNATIMVQNPNQIYIVTIWPSEGAMLAADFSFSRRLTGVSAFLLAGLGIFCGIALGVWHFLLYQTAQRALAKENMFIIHGTLKTDAGCQAVFSPDAGAGLQLRQPVFLLDHEGVEQGTGVLHECSQRRHSALFSPDCAPPRYGWLLRCAPRTEAARE